MTRYLAEQTLEKIKKSLKEALKYSTLSELQRSRLKTDIERNLRDYDELYRFVHRSRD